ncbi:MAG: NAD-dependent epimerase/dehydratase family protein [Spirochaetaceae bacterium]|nr:MAG: NAD-dependent epimerase/dehydratase family protein [Spirochaetaceae bacterium]
MHTILGSNGAVGTALAKALNAYTEDLRLVSRAPRRVNPGDELMSLNLFDSAAVMKAVEGSDVVYVTIGFPGQGRLWSSNWLSFIQNVLAAARENAASVVFFDNVLLYDPDHLGDMTESTPVRPVTRKATTRARVAEIVMEAAASESPRALIARSADLIAPTGSLVVEMVYRRLAAGENAQWIGSLDKAHSCTYVHDAARAVALLGNTPEAFGRAWHLPTDPTPLTGTEWVELFAREMGLTPRVDLLKSRSLKLSGLFNSQTKELADIAYLFDREYRFKSEDFVARFRMEPTPAAGAVNEIITTMRR